MPKYNTDKPVNQKEQDFFQRYQFSKRIANSIKAYDNSDCVVFGISGVWGEGKTSVLNFIETELSSSYPKILTLRFNPWRYNDENTLLSSLFNSLAERIKNSIEDKKKKKGFFSRPILVQNDDDPLKREIETIGELLQEYGEIASVFGMGGLVKTIGKGLSSVDIERKKERIENILEKLERRLVIFVDDIDRLDKNEIYSILKIVKLTGDFKYMTYILSFDEDMVASAIGERFGKGDAKAGHNFLEKIIQIPLKIPKAQKASLKNFCFNIVDSAIERSKINFTEKDAQRFVGNFSSHVLSRLTTPRLAIRYGNSLQFSLPILNGEINNVDLMLIESIKIFFPDVYQFIKLNPDIFTGKNSNSYDLRRDNSKIEKTKSKIDEALSGYSGIEKSGIFSLLETLFPQLKEVYSNYHYQNESYNEWYTAKRICSPKYFDRYFTYAVPDGDISDVIFEGIIAEVNNLSDTELSQKFVELIESANVDEFLHKIRSREKIFTWEEAQLISKALVLIGKQFSDKSLNSFFGFSSPLSQAAIFIYHLIDRGSSNEEKFNLAKELMIKADTFAFSGEINRWLRRGMDEEKVFSIEEYQALSRVLIDRALKEAEDKPIFETHDKYVTYMLGSWSEINKPEFSNYINAILEKDKSKVVTLLKACTPTMTSTGYPEPYKSDFTKEQFDWLKNVLDTKYLYDVIIEINDGKLDISDVKFSQMEPNPSLENIVKQFVYWYEKEQKED